MSWLVGGPPGLAYQREREVLKRHDSTPPRSWLRERYEQHRQRIAPTRSEARDPRAAHPVEDAFDLPPQWRVRAERRASREALLRRLDEMLWPPRTVMPAPQTSACEVEGCELCAKAPSVQMAREFYDDGA